METKLSKVVAAMDVGDWEGALAIAASFPRLGEHKEAIQRAHGVFERPDFYRQLGYDLDKVIADGREALVARYGHKGA